MATTTTGTQRRRAARPRRAKPTTAAQEQTVERGVYATHFNHDELERILAGISEPVAGLDAAIHATYVLLDRIIARMTPEGAANNDDEEGRRDDIFLKLVTAHNATTGRIAQLLRTRRVIADDAADSLTGHIAAALDELAERMQVTL